MEIKNLRDAIEFIRGAVFNDIAIGQLVMFLYIADYEGVTQPELSEALEMSQGAVSRNCAKLSTKIVPKSLSASLGNKYEDRGYNLIEQRQDSIDSRRKALFLSDLGRKVVEELRKI